MQLQLLHPQCMHGWMAVGFLPWQCGQMHTTLRIYSLMTRPRHSPSPSALEARRVCPRWCACVASGVSGRRQERSCCCLLVYASAPTRTQRCCHRPVMEAARLHHRHRPMLHHRTRGQSPVPCGPLRSRAAVVSQAPVKAACCVSGTMRVVAGTHLLHTDLIIAFAFRLDDSVAWLQGDHRHATL